MGSKPSCHAVMTGTWQPSSADSAANRQPGFGTTTNIINGGVLKDVVDIMQVVPLAQCTVDYIHSWCRPGMLC